MNKIKILTVCAVFALACASVYAQEGQVDRATVPFSKPGQPGLVKVGLHNGGLIVKGYNGQEVIVEARARTRAVSKRKPNEKAAGMKLIQISTTGLSITEENNEMKISVESLRRTVDLTIQVPFNTSLKVSAFNRGDVEVENISGEIEAKNHNGSIRLSNISGAAVANTFNGEVIVTFDKVTPDKPMSFATWNGDVDVTFPANLKANVMLQSQRGDVYSDYEISLMESPKRPKRGERNEEGKLKISFDHAIYGAINGGGPEYSFKNYNGDIFIRAKK